MNFKNGYPRITDTNIFLYPHINGAYIGIIISVPVNTCTCYTLT